MYEINGVKVTERGWAGHFCSADLCRFRRNTLLEYNDKKWIVSTVGSMRDYFNGGIDTIGLNRYYETMVFEAEEVGNAESETVYWDANVSNQIDFDSNWALDIYDFGTDLKANEMHENVVKELIEKIKL